MKRYFLSGIVLFLPLTVTIYLIAIVIEWVTHPFINFFFSCCVSAGTQHSPHVVWAVRLFILVMLFFLIIVLGMIGKRFFVSWCLRWVDRFMDQIPVIKTLYHLLKEIVQRLFLRKKGPVFKERVMVPFLHEDTRVLGLSTGHFEIPNDASHQSTLQSVFIPTSPHPSSGFLVLYKEEQIESLTDFKNDDLVKFLVSCGAIVPDTVSADERPE